VEKSDTGKASIDENQNGDWSRVKSTGRRKWAQLQHHHDQPPSSAVATAAAAKQQPTKGSAEVISRKIFHETRGLLRLREVRWKSGARKCAQSRLVGWIMHEL
jgi:hypothetical protein